MLCRISKKFSGVTSLNTFKSASVCLSSSFSTVPTKKVPLSERVKSIDTSLTDEQKTYVESLKKRLKGGKYSPKSIYREVPTPDEVKGLGYFMPRIAENAEELIDYALSHIPKQTGPRRSRAKKRMALKQAQKRTRDKQLKEEKKAAYQRKLAKKNRIRKEIKDMWAQVYAIREKEAAVAALKAKSA